MDGRTLLPRRRWGARLFGIAALIAVTAAVVLNCSGMRFGISDPLAKLNRRLSDDLGLALPAGAAVPNAVRVATLDPVEYYRIELPDPAAAASFLARVRTSATDPQDDESPPAWSSDRQPPDWWRAQDLPGLTRLSIFTPGGRSLMWYFSESSGTLYLVWVET